LKISSLLDVTAGISPSYTASNFLEEFGCSPFGFNNFTLGMFSGVPFQHRKNISLSIIDQSFKKVTTDCVWKSQSIECSCLSLSDVTIQLPNSYQILINVNEVEKIPLTDSNGNNVLLTYFKPSFTLFHSTYSGTFTFFPSGKSVEEYLQNIVISGMDSFLNTAKFNYNWYLRQKYTALDLQIPNCSLNVSEKSFSCDVSFLSSNNTNTYNGFSNVITPTNSISLETLCGCVLKTYCLNSNFSLVNETSCCYTAIVSNSTDNTTMSNQTTCTSAKVQNCAVCQLYPVVRISDAKDSTKDPTIYEAPTPFNYYRLFHVKLTSKEHQRFHPFLQMLFQVTKFQLLN
jgi:hypothetical protein